MAGRDPERSVVDAIKDRLAESTGKHRVGFEPSVCEGCPHRGDPPLRACGLCGCPTTSGLLLDRTNSVPDGCPRIDEHERKSDFGGGNPDTSFR